MIQMTPEILAGLYDVLRLTKPFKGWSLPHSDDVGFHTSEVDTPQGEWWFDKTTGQHQIRVSAKKHHTLYSAMTTISHEMVHMHEHQIGVRMDVHHGWTFKKFARSVCKWHHFDLGQF
jgi:hypothetical protein